MVMVNIKNFAKIVMQRSPKHHIKSRLTLETTFTVLIFIILGKTEY